VALALSGAALATLSPEQLLGLRLGPLVPSTRRSRAPGTTRQRMSAPSEDAPAPAHDPPANRPRRPTARGERRRPP
jgi:hypothetical protein